MTDSEITALLATTDPYVSPYGSGVYWCLKQDESPEIIRSQGELPKCLFDLVDGHQHGPFAIRYKTESEAIAAIDKAVEKYRILN